jgi:nicotinamidase-related amidase
MTAEPLSPTAAVFLLVDHQTGVFERVVKAPPRERVEANVLRLARAAALLDIPVILTTSEEEGENGPLLPALEPILPNAYTRRIARHGLIDSLAHPAVAEALAATGRRQLVTAGIGTEVCGVAPALHARHDGYEVAFVADACGSATALGHDITLRRLGQHGVSVTTTASVSAELAGDYPKHATIMHGEQPEPTPTPNGAAKRSDGNRQLARQVLEELFEKGHLDATDELIHPDFVNHEAPRTTPRARRPQGDHHLAALALGPQCTPRSRTRSAPATRSSPA